MRKMRFDGKTTRQRATKLGITELSGVTQGAHEGADVTIMKLDPAQRLLKSVYAEQLNERVVEERVRDHLQPLWNMNSALREAAEQIVTDTTITDKQAAMRESVMDYLNSVLTLFNQQPPQEANMPDTIKQEELDTLKAQLQRAESVAKLNDASKAYFETLDESAQSDFLKMSETDQASTVKMFKADDESFTTADGAVIKKSDAGSMYATIKAQDEALRKLQNDQTLQKAREEVNADIPNVPGDALVKVSTWQALSKLDEVSRKFITDTLKAADKLWATRKEPAGVPGGGDGDDAHEKLNKMVGEYQTTHKVSKAVALQKVVDTPEGEALYKQTRGE